MAVTWISQGAVHEPDAAVICTTGGRLVGFGVGDGDGVGCGFGAPPPPEPGSGVGCGRGAPPPPVRESRTVTFA